MVDVELSVTAPLPPTASAHRPEPVYEIWSSYIVSPLFVFEGLLALLLNWLTGLVLDTKFSIAVA